MTAIGDPSAPSGRSGSVFWPHRRGTIRHSGCRLAHTGAAPSRPGTLLSCIRPEPTVAADRQPGRKTGRKPAVSPCPPGPDIKSAHADRSVAMTEHAVVIAGGGPKGLTLALAGVVAQVAQFFGIPLDSCGFPGQGET